MVDTPIDPIDSTVTRLERNRLAKSRIEQCFAQHFVEPDHEKSYFGVASCYSVAVDDASNSVEPYNPAANQYFVVNSYADDSDRYSAVKPCSDPKSPVASTDNTFVVECLASLSEVVP